MITIRNKKTGETKQIEDTQLGEFGLAPALSNKTPTATATPTPTASPKITYDQLYKMSLDPNVKTATYNRLKALYDLGKEEEKASKPDTGGTVEERKAQGLAKAGVRALDIVKSEYEADPAVVVKQKVPGKFFSRKFDSALFNSVDTLLRLRTGAQAPDSEVRNYMNAFGPRIGDSPDVVEHKLNQLKADLLDAAGQSDQFSPVKIQTAPGKSTGLLGQVGEAFLPNTTEAIKTVGRTPEIFSKAAQEVGEKGLFAVPSPELRKLAGGSDEDTGNRLLNAFKDAEKRTKTQAYAGGEIAGTISAVKATQRIKDLFGASKRSVAARKTFAKVAEGSGEIVSKDVYKNAAEQALKDATPDEIPYLEKIFTQSVKKGSKGNIKPTDALKLMVKAGQKSFTKGGDPKSAASASFNLALREELRKEFTKIAPGVIEETTKMANIKRVQKGASKTLRVVGSVAAGVGLLNFFLGKRGGGGGGD